MQSSKFKEWKETGSLLWIRGNRTLLSLSSPLTINPFPKFTAGAGKSVLWYAPLVHLRDREVMLF
jgi:hypothetical protein